MAAARGSPDSDAFASALTDEQFALELQKQFDEEEAEKRRQEHKDGQLASSISDDWDTGTPWASTSTAAGSVGHNPPSMKGASDVFEDQMCCPESQQRGEKRGAQSLSDNIQHFTSSDDKPFCQYGASCYRKNPQHWKEFRHNEDAQSEAKRRKRTSIADCRTASQTVQSSGPCRFLLTTVEGMSDKFNGCHSLSLTDLLSADMGALRASVQFNYMFEVRWLINQYPQEFRTKPLLLVHGLQREEFNVLQHEAGSFPNVTLAKAKLEIIYGTHHTKMMVLLYDASMRVVIHTSNMIERDWAQKTQGMWVSPVFPYCGNTVEPPVQKQHNVSGDSETLFKTDLIAYLSAYHQPQLEPWIQHVQEHDMSAARVFLVGSVPGRHTGPSRFHWGHMKLRQVLEHYGPPASYIASAWPVIGQFSSIGSLGPGPDTWLCGEWLQSLSMTSQCRSVTNRAPLKLVFPTVDDVRLSLEGYPAGGSIPYSERTARKQTYLVNFFHTWRSEVCGRTRAMPHIKSYTRVSPDGAQVAWFLLTSANLSKAAWGTLEKGASQLMIRSYELGVLFLADRLTKDGNEVFTLSGENTDGDELLLPYDLPLKPYSKTDKPWLWDVAHTALPDTHGNVWFPS